MKVTLGERAEKLSLKLIGDSSVELSGIASLRDAGPGQLTFLFSASYLKFLPDCTAAAVILNEDYAASATCPVLISESPRLTWAKVAALFDPKPLPSLTIHPTAVISPSATLGSQVTVGANVVIEANARIDANAIIGAGCFIGERVFIGENSELAANVSIYHDVSLGRSVRVHSNAVLGADGFGFEFDGGSMSLCKIPQIYGLKVGNNVEIGAGTTIDRGALNDTLIGNGVKLDNQVQIGHGTTIGDHTAISGCTAIAGSTKIGRYCLIGGAVGIIDNIEITDQVEITAMSLVSRSITEKGRYSSGTGLMPGKIWKRNIVGFSKLHEILRRLRRLEKQKET